MGGAQAGEIASRIAASVLRDSGAAAGRGHRRRADPGGEPARLRGGGERRGPRRDGHDGHRRPRRGRTPSGSATSATRARTASATARSKQLTDDHSLVAELVRSGRLSPEEADIHPQRSVITRVLGTDPDVDVDTFTVEARPGDVFMICSDGLTSMVDDASILDAGRAEPGEPRPGRARARRRGEQGRRRGQHHGRSLFEIGDATGAEPAALPERSASSGRTTRTRLPSLDAVPDSRSTTRRWSAATSSRRSARPPGAARSGGYRRAVIADRRRRRRRRPRGARRLDASPARTSSAPRRTVTSPSTRASRGTSSAACVSTGCATRAPCSPASSRRPSGAGCSTTTCAELRAGARGGQALRGRGGPVTCRSPTARSRAPPHWSRGAIP